MSFKDSSMLGTWALAP